MLVFGFNLVKMCQDYGLYYSGIILQYNFEKKKLQIHSSHTSSMSKRRVVS